MQNSDMALMTGRLNMAPQYKFSKINGKRFHRKDQMAFCTL